MCHRQIKISLYFPSKKISAFFCQKDEDLPLLFHKILEGMQSCMTSEGLQDAAK